MHKYTKIFYLAICFNKIIFPGGSQSTGSYFAWHDNYTRHCNFKVPENPKVKIVVAALKSPTTYNKLPIDLKESYDLAHKTITNSFALHDLEFNNYELGTKLINDRIALYALLSYFTEEQRDNLLTQFLIEIGPKAKNFDIIKELLEAGANAQIQSSRGLYQCVKYNLVGAAILFIKHGADVQVHAHSSVESPLREATRGNKVRMVKVLLKAGAYSLAKDYEGKTALYYAQQKNYTQIISLLEDAEKIDSKKADDFLKAAREDNSELIQQLLNIGVDIETEDEVGNTALMIAIQNKNGQMVVDLVKAGAKILRPNKNNKTAHDVALECGSKDPICRNILVYLTLKM